MAGDKNPIGDAAVVTTGALATVGVLSLASGGVLAIPLLFGAAVAGAATLLANASNKKGK